MGFKQPNSYFFLLLVANLYLAHAGELVPVFMWHKGSTKGSLPALSHVNKDTFKEIIQQKQTQLGSEKLIIFAEENLSPEDFSVNDKITFKDLTSLSEFKTYLPTVVTPLEAIESFVPDVKVVSITDIKTNPKLLENNRIIISLNDAKDDEDRVDMLRRHSKFISDVYRELQAKNVLAIYTGYHSSWIVPNEIRKQRHERSTDGDKKEPGMSGKTRNFLYYIDGSFQAFSSSDSKVKEPDVFNATGITQETDHLVIATTAQKEVNVYFYYDESKRYWHIKKVEYEGKVYTTNIYAPEGFGYSCTSNKMLTSYDPKKPKEPTYYLQLANFQLQYSLDEVPERFGDAYDCVGFTSAPIWSGLFVTFILAIIMTMGLTVIMDIKTMDRFDDPKGKTIVVNAVE